MERNASRSWSYVLAIAALLTLTACSERTPDQGPETSASSPPVSPGPLLGDLPPSWIAVEDDVLVDGRLVVGVLLPHLSPRPIAGMMSPGALAAVREQHPGPGDPEHREDRDDPAGEYDAPVIKDTEFPSTRPHPRPHGGIPDPDWVPLVQRVRDVAARIRERTGFEVLVREVTAEDAGRVPLLFATSTNAHGTAAPDLRRYVDHGGVLFVTRGRPADVEHLAPHRIGPRVPAWAELAPLDHPFISAVHATFTANSPPVPPLMAAFSAKGRICAATSTGRDAEPRAWLVALLCAHASRHGNVTVLPRSPLRLHARPREGDALVVGVDAAPSGVVTIALRGPVGTEPRTVVTGEGTAEVRLPLSDERRNPLLHHVVATWTRGDLAVRRSIGLDEMLPLREQRVFAPSTFPVGGSAAVRVFLDAGKERRPVVDETVRVRLVREATTIAEATGTTDARGHVAMRLEVPATTEHGGAKLVVGDREFPVTLRSELRACVVPDQPLYLEDAPVNLRVMLHEFPSGCPAANVTLVARVRARTSRWQTTGFARLTTSRHGIGSVTFDTSGWNPGWYDARIMTDGQRPELARTSFRIAEFERPTFQVATTPRRIRLTRSGAPTEVTLHATYLDGTPVVGASLKLEGASSLAVRPPAATDTKGCSLLQLAADDTVSALPDLAVNVTDPAGRLVRHPLVVAVESRSALSLHLAPLRQPVIGVAGPVQVRAMLAGRPARGDVTLHLHSDPEKRHTVALDARGRAVCHLTPRQVSDTLIADARIDGRTGEARRTLVAKAPTHEPVLALDRLTWRDDEVVTGTIHGPDGPTFVDLLRGGVLLASFSVDITNGRGVLTAPLRSDFVGEVVFAAHVVAGLDVVGTSQRALILSSNVLEIDATPERTSHRPGTRAAVDVKVFDRDGRPTPAALGYWAVDHGVLELAHDDPSPMSFRSLSTTDAGLTDHAETVLRGGGGPDSDLSARDALGQVVTTNQGIHAIRDRRSDGLLAQRRDHLETETEFLRSYLHRTLRDGLRALPTDAVLTSGSWRAFVRHLIAQDASPRASWIDVRGVPLALATTAAGVAVISAGYDGRFETDDDVVAELDRERMAAIVPARVAALLEHAHSDGTRWFFGPGAQSTIAVGGRRNLRALGGGGKSRRGFGSGAGGSGPVIPVRRDLAPRLVFVPEVLTDDQGRARLDIPLNDAITSWRLNLAATAASGGVGFAQTDLRVTKSLHVAARVPKQLTVGDALSLPVVMHNGTTDGLDVEVAHELVGDAVTAKAPDTTTIRLAAGGIGHLTLQLRARAPGASELKLSVRAGSHVDAVAYPIAVAPNARSVETATPFNVSRTAPADLQVTLPPSTPSASWRLVVWADAASEALDGMEGLLKRPAGCCEQTASTMLPMVLALERLRVTGVATPEHNARAQKWLREGRDRILGYEVPGGGFSLYGRAPADPAVTAYAIWALKRSQAVLQSLGPEAKGVREVTDRAHRWLEANLAPDGSWSRDRQSWSLTDRRRTAYVAGLLSLSGYRVPKPALRLLADTPPHPDGYAEAFAALALKPGTGQATTPFPTATSLRLPDLPSPFGGRGRSVDVIALAVRCDLLRSQGRQAAAERVLQALLKHRDPHGRFGSTQATYFALRAIAGMASGGSKPARLTIRVGDLDPIAATTTPGEPLRLDLPATTAGKHRVRITSESEVPLRGALVVTRWAPWAGSSSEGPLQLDLSWPAEPMAAGEGGVCAVTARNVGRYGAAAPVITLGLPPSVDVDASRIRGRYAHVERSRRGLLVYLHDLGANDSVELDIPFRTRHAADVRTRPSELVAPYHPESAVVEPPARLVAR